MRRPIRALVAASMLFGLGWMTGHAQTRQPLFKIVVDRPTGDTKIACVRGCTLHWVVRGIPDTVNPGPTFSYGCTAANDCSSGGVGGWVEK